MAKDVTTFMRSYYEAAQCLPSKELQADFLMAILAFAFDGEDISADMDPLVQAMVCLVTPVMRSNAKRGERSKGGSHSAVTHPPEAEEAGSDEEQKEMQNEVVAVTPQSLPSHSAVTQQSLGSDPILRIKDKGQGIEDKGNNILSSSSCAHTHEDDPPGEDAAFGTVMQLYTDQIHPCPNSLIIAQLMSFTGELGAPVVCHAIKSALAVGQTSFAYIRGILNNYKADGVTTMEAVQRREAEHEAARRQKGKGRNFSRSAADPDPAPKVDMSKLKALAASI